ncbi:MAG: hypothetical protein PHX78_06840 [bacterium]|nr:hypothetical protein [bacterium]
MPDKKDDIFEEAKRNLEKLGETVVGLAKKGKEEGINLYHTGKLRLDIVNLKHKVEGNFNAIGKKVYKNHKIEDNEIIKLCADIDKLEAMVKNKEAEIEKIINSKQNNKDTGL